MEHVLRLREVNGTLFIANDEETGPYLWKTDGAMTLAAPVTERYLMLDRDLVKVKDTLFFPADGSSAGTGLWKSDGTDAGTVLVKVLTSDSWRIHYQCLVAVEDELFFSVYLAGGSYVLWKSDGTEAGTVVVKDFGPISSSPCVVPDAFLEGTGSVLLTVDDGANTTLWKSDGTEAGTVPLHGAGTPGRPLAPEGFARVGDTVFFSARGEAGQELWKTDGTAEGTRLVKD
ncbi:MAG: hypothetical protein ABW123_15235, partial [Cystobacter sp.]